jgi:hypothetical protein
MFIIRGIISHYENLLGFSISQKKMENIINKKAQGTSVSFIISFIIGVIVLVIAAFMIYNYYNSGSLIGGGKVNVGSVVQNCQVSCSSNGFYDYCTRTRNIVFDDTGKKNPRNNQPYTCRQLETENVGLDKCDVLACDVQYYKCADLAQTNCAGVDALKCHVNFVTPAEVKTYQDNVGKIYSEVKPLTVTDPAEKSTGNVCLKIVDI